MSHGKQFTLYSSKGGPNGWLVLSSFRMLFSLHILIHLACRKVVAVLEELGLTYEIIFLDLLKGEQKAESHIKFNPNGRIPTLIDHKNNDFALW